MIGHANSNLQIRGTSTPMPSAGIMCLVSSTLLLNDESIAYVPVAAMLWTTIHLPFIMAYVLAGAALSRLVLATDCHDANVEDLTDAYTDSSKPEVSSALRWFYCAGLGIALLCMSRLHTSLQCLLLQSPPVDR